MKKTQISYFIATLLAALGILGLTFTAGYNFRATADDHQVSSEVQLPREFLASIKPGAGVHGARPDLKPFEYLWEVMQALKQHYVEPGKIDETQLTYGAVRGILKALGDRYTRFMDPEEYADFSVKNAGEFEGIGAQLGVGYLDETTKEQGLKIVAPLPGSPAEKAGLKKGDFILKIDGKSTEDMALEVAVHMIRGPRGSKIKLTIGRKGVKDPLDVTIVRDTIEIHTVRFEMMENSIGYIHLREFNEKTDKELTSAFAELQKKGMKGLIFDLRNDPGGLLDVAVDVASLFMQTGTVVYTKNRTGKEEALKVEPERYLGLKIPIALLINGGSASASEIVSGALQDGKLAHLIGERSFGKASVQLLVPLQNGGALAVTTAKYFTPAKRDITDKGIEPDEVVKLDEDTFTKNGDVQLKKAIEYCKKEAATAGLKRAPAAEALRPTKQASRPMPTNLYNCVPWTSFNG